MIEIKSEDFNIEKIADSGQCFRLNRVDDYWLNVSGKNFVKIYHNNVLDCSKYAYNALWKPYFDLETDYSAFRGQIPKKDKFLSKAADFGKGIRILRQDPWEMLISFIISQRKNIPAIKSCIETICRKYGEIITDAPYELYSFPSSNVLASLSESDLSDCSLGYRIPYVLSAARMVESGELDLNAIKKLSDADLLEELMKVKGVGIKVANCVSLFAYHRIDAFPIDVWIARVIEEKYNNRFPFDRYEGFGGVIQQYMFYYARNNKL